MGPGLGTAPGVMDALPKKAKPAPIDGDIPYIRCGVCELLSQRMYSDADQMIKMHAPKQQKKTRLESSANLGGLEDNIEYMLLHICDPEQIAGKWIRELDVVKAGSSLTLKQMSLGKCRRECRTIAKACGAVLETMTEEEEDLGEVILQ